jgi:hypothetical protein
MTATYTVDIKRLTIRDMATLQRASTQGLELSTILPILNRIVITDDGSSAEDLPYEHLEQILLAVGERISKPNPT